MTWTSLVATVLLSRYPGITRNQESQNAGVRHLALDMDDARVLHVNMQCVSPGSASAARCAPGSKHFWGIRATRRPTRSTMIRSTMSNSPRHPPPPALSPYQQAQAATLIRSVRARLLAEDPDLWLNTLDGESDAVDLIRNLVRASIDADLLAEAARKRQAEIAGRAERAERRKQALRAAAFALMDLAGITRLPEPDFLARIQAGQPHLGDLDADTVNKLNVGILPIASQARK